MRRQSIILLAGVAGLLAVGCTIGEDADVSTEPSPDTAAPAEAQTFAEPLISQKPDDADAKDGKDDQAKTAKKGDKVLGLLESTDPEERAKQVQAGIRSRAGLDPFASLPPILTFNTPVTNEDSGRGSSRITGTPFTTTTTTGSRCYFNRSKLKHYDELACI